METGYLWPIALAVVGSGFVSTILTIANSWAKDYFLAKREAKDDVFKIRKDIHNDFVEYMDFL